MGDSGRSIRYHFTAPASDTQIAEWVNNQHNFSTSMRIVIKDYIARHGMTDASCLPLSFSVEPIENNSIEEPMVATTKKEVSNEVAEPVDTPEQVVAKANPQTEKPAVKEKDNAADMLADMLS